MWEQLMMDSDEEYLEPDEDMEVQMEDPLPPAGTTGLALAEHYFGPLLSPVAANPAKWTAYTEHRRAAKAEYKNLFEHRKRYISDTVSEIEAEMGLDDGTLQKCIYILSRGVWYDDDVPHGLEISVRIYSPTTPGYIDVHIKWYQYSRMYHIDWYYTLGYKLFTHPCGSPTGYRHPSTSNGPPSDWHTRGGWQSICWGYYDNDNGNYGRNWREIEKGEVELQQQGVLNIHEMLFGPIDPPASDEADTVLAYRK